MEFSWGMGPPSTYGGGWWRMFPRTPDALKVRCRIADAAAAASGHNTRMDIILNGQSLPLPDQTTLAALLEAQHLAPRRVAVEINGESIPRRLDRKSGGSGTSVSVRVDLGGRRIIKQKRHQTRTTNKYK